MFFNYKKKSNKLFQAHIKERKILSEYGICDEDINELFRFDKRQLYSDYKFALNNDNYADLGDEFFKINRSFSLGVLDEINSVQLYKALNALNDLELKVIMLHVIDGYNLRETAKLLTLTYDTVMHKYYNSIKKIKSFLKAASFVTKD
jgi:DNA-directed RNA polymerase specialized sigma subunit, sigma24 homolog